jgi:hypothetical protein
MSDHTSHFSPQVRNPNGLSSAYGAQRTNTRSTSQADIAKRAYQKYEARGCAHGFDREDWAAASRELLAETSGYTL